MKANVGLDYKNKRASTRDVEDAILAYLEGVEDATISRIAAEIGQPYPTVRDAVNRMLLAERVRCNDFAARPRKIRRYE